MSKKLYLFFVAFIPILPFLVGTKAIWIYNLFLIAISIVYLNFHSYYSRKSFLLLIPILWCLIISFPGNFYLVTQSFFYLSTPFLFTFYGMQLSKIITKEQLLSFIVYAGTVSSVLYVGYGFLIVGSSMFSDVYAIRNVLFVGSICSVISFFVLVCSFKTNFDINLSKPMKYLLVCLNGLSLVLSGSRTYYISFFLFLFFFLFYYYRRLFFYGLTGVILLLIYLFSLDSNENLFVYKVQSSLTEINTSKSIDSYEDANLYYRAYEAKMVIDEINRGRLFDLIVGSKMDRLVTLDLYIKLGETFRNKIPIVHNGYLYILFRIGVLGFFFFFLFFLYVYKCIRQIKASLFYYCLFFPAILTLLISNFVVTSFFTTEMSFVWILIGFLIVNPKQFLIKNNIR